MSPGHRIDGDGPDKVLVLHGWFGDETMLAPALPHLNLAARSYATLACRGYGASLDAAGLYTMGEIAEDALSLADALGWARFSVLGHSMGGKAAMLVAARAPSRVRAVIAVTPVSLGPVPFDPQGWALFSGAATDVDKRAAVIDHSTGGKLTSTWVRGLAGRSSAQSREAAFRAYLDAWALEDLSHEVVSVRQPLLALVGANDPNITADGVRDTLITRRDRAEIIVVADAGHYPIDETPGLFAAHVENFLEKPSIPT